MSHKYHRKIIFLFIVLLLAGCATTFDVEDIRPGPTIPIEPELYTALRPTHPTDNNQDGKITKLEITRQCEWLFFIELQRADLNNDGLLSEYDLTYARTKAPGAIIWTGMDNDRSAKISLNELHSYVLSSVNVMLRKYDINKDRAISQKEFVSQIQKKFKSLDKDGNGSLDKNEITDFNLGPRIAPRDQMVAMKECDNGVWGCSWSLPAGCYEAPCDGSDGRPESPCVKNPSLPYCASLTHPGCTNEDVSSDNCYCPGPGYECVPVF